MRNILAEYLDSKKVTHLVVFPDWYPSLTEGFDTIFLYWCHVFSLRGWDKPDCIFLAVKDDKTVTITNRGQWSIVRKLCQKLIRIKLFRYLIFACSAVYLFLYLFVVISRINYPFELEWIEGGMLQVVQRVVDGQGIYVSPSISFVPFLYPPGYFYLSAGFSLVLGDGFFPLRLVSLLASLVSFLVIYLIVFEETKSGWAAFFSTCLFAACYRVTGAWLDVARVDSLFLAFSLLAVYFTRGKVNIPYSLLAGLFFALAIFTKQTGLILAIPLLFFLFIRNWKHGIAFLGAVCILLIPITVILDKQTSGWYTYYVYELLAQQAEWLPLEFVNFWKNDLIIHLPITLLIALFFLSDEFGKNKQRFILWALILSGAVASSFFSRVKIGGYENVLLPMFGIFCIITGLGLPRIFALIHTGNSRRAELFVYIACFIQLITLAYNPFAQIPSKQDLIKGNQLVAYLSNMEGEIYIPDHGYLLSRLGKNTFAHHAAIWDVLRTDKMTEGKQILTTQLENTIQSQLFDVIIMDEEGNFCCPEIDGFYTRVGEVFDDDISFYPVTGDKRRPTYIYIANRLR